MCYFKKLYFHYNDFISKASYLKPLHVQLPYVGHEDSDDLYIPQSVFSNDHNGATDSASDSSYTSSESYQHQIRQSVGIRKIPVWMNDYSTNYAQLDFSNIIDKTITSQFSSFLTSLTTVVDPTSYKQAVRYQHRIDVMNCELEALEINGTWQITN